MKCRTHVNGWENDYNKILSSAEKADDYFTVISKCDPAKYLVRKVPYTYIVKE